MCVCLGNHVHILAIILASILAAKTSSSGSGSGSTGIWVKVARHMPLINLCMPRIDFHASQTQQQQQQLEQRERRHLLLASSRCCPLESSETGANPTPTRRPRFNLTANMSAMWAWPFVVAVAPRANYASQAKINKKIRCAQTNILYMGYIAR